MHRDINSTSGIDSHIEVEYIMKCGSELEPQYIDPILNTHVAPLEVFCMTY